MKNVLILARGGGYEEILFKIFTILAVVPVLFSRVGPFRAILLEGKIMGNTYVNIFYF